ncbi:MAG: hypothetical protein HYW96_00580 [Candidatus Wildermuthbacteria bacterium]|nr:hypothetical protein [Candidatus Wildermuthbacteria bacterium]
MEHIAIMRKSWGLTKKILSGQKTVESRWYSVKYRPWNRIKAGETVYFKDSGNPVRLKAHVKKVMQFQNLTPNRVRKLLNKYGKDDGIEKLRAPEFYKRFKYKKYCILVFLKNPKRIKPFFINKKGFGLLSSWLIVNDILRIKK